MSGGRRTARSSTGRAMVRKSRGRGHLLGRSALAALAAILVGWGVLHWQAGRHSAGSASPVRIARDAVGTARLARAAEKRGDLEGALAIYREGVRRFPRDAVLLGSFGTATTNRSFAVHSNRGRLVPVAPTSHARTAAAHEAIRLLDAAQRESPRLSQPALQKGLLYAAWGLPEDALVELYGAVVRGNRSPELERTAGAITQLQLARPDHAGAATTQKGRPARR